MYLVKNTYKLYKKKTVNRKEIFFVIIYLEIYTQNNIESNLNSHTLYSISYSILIVMSSYIFVAYFLNKYCNKFIFV